MSSTVRPSGRSTSGMSTAAGHQVRGKVPRQALTALGVDTEYTPVGQLMLRRRSREAPQDPGA